MRKMFCYICDSCFKVIHFDKVKVDRISKKGKEINYCDRCRAIYLKSQADKILNKIFIEDHDIITSEE